MTRDGPRGPVYAAAKHVNLKCVRARCAGSRRVACNMVGSAPVDDHYGGQPEHRGKRSHSLVTFTLAFFFWSPFRYSCSPSFSNVVSTKGSLTSSFLARTWWHGVRVLNADLGNVLLHVEISRCGSWWSNSGCCGGNHNESAAELVQDSEPKLAQEIHHRVCRELPNGARQRQKPQQNSGNPTAAARQQSWEAADVHMHSSQTVPELDEYDEKWSGDDVDDHGPKLTKHSLTTCWTSPTNRRSLPKTSAFCVGMRRRLGSQTMAVVRT